MTLRKQLPYRVVQGAIALALMFSPITESVQAEAPPQPKPVVRKAGMAEGSELL